MRYLITGNNNDETGEFILYDSANPGMITKSNHAAEIRDHMFTGDYTFTILPKHPHYEDIVLRKTIVTVRDIEDSAVIDVDHEIVFRGDVISIKTDKFGVKSIRCQPDIQWLADVPDVFSKIVDNDTVFYIGYERGVANLWFRSEGTNYLGQDKATYRSAPVYGSYERNSYVTLNSIWDDYLLRPNMVGLTFSVECKQDSREMPMRRFLVERSNETNPIQVLYFGNAALLYETLQGQFFLNGITDDLTVLQLDLMWRHVPSEFPTPEAHTPPVQYVIPPLEDIRTAEGGDAETLAGLDYCIVHYYDPKLEAYTGTNQPDVIGRGRNWTKVYTLIEQPPTPLQEPVACSRTTRTSVQNMVDAIFNDADAAIKGYNLFCEPSRRIYRGNIDVDGELDHSGVDTVYSNISAWLDATGGYARIRHEWINGGVAAFLDLMKDSGIEDKNFEVRFADNLTEYGKTQDVTGLYTSIYVRGVYSDSPTYFSLADADYDDGQGITQIVSQVDHYILDTTNGIVNFKLALPNDPPGEDYSWMIEDVAVDDYGKIVMYKEYPLDRVPNGQERQYLYDRAVEDLREALKSYTSFDISAIDKRLLRRPGATRPVLGNYSAVTMPIHVDGKLAFNTTNRQLTKIGTDHINPSSSKMTFGDKKPILSDFVSKESK